jgi:hypothetical protein
MKVICKGYNTCHYNDKCYHAKQHVINPNCITYKDIIADNLNDMCECSCIFLRQKKLEKFTTL